MRRARTVWHRALVGVAGVWLAFSLGAQGFVCAEPPDIDLASRQPKSQSSADWHAVDARLAAADASLRAGLSEAAREQLLAADQSNARGAALYREGKYAEAARAFAEVAEVRDKLLGEKHPESIATLNNLAGLYQAMGDCDQAEPLYRKALDLKRETFGEQHPSYASSVNNLAALYDQMGEYARAETLYRQSLDLRKRTLGDKHPDYANSLNNLASHYRALGYFAQAEPLYRDALAIRQQTLGVDHPDYATSLNNLAILLDDTGKYSLAEPLFRQSLEIRRSALGAEHPLYAASVHNLAGHYHDAGDFARAEPLYRESLAISKRTLGPTHLNVANSLSDLAVLCEDLGDYARAEPLLREAIEITKYTRGGQHADHATRLHNLAALYLATGDYARAEPLFRRALEIKRNELGRQHPSYATTLNNLAGVYQAMGDYARAEPLFIEALEVRKRVLGALHRDRATSLNNLAGLYATMGNNARAEPLYREAAEVYKRTVGEHHPDYASSLSNLAVVCRAAGDYEQAASLYSQALEIRKRAFGEEHPDVGSTLHNLALLAMAQGDPARGVPLARQSAHIARRQLNLTAAAQSERQQLAMTRQMRIALDGFLSVGVAANLPAKEMYDEVLAWKGAVFARQQLLRTQRRALAAGKSSQVAELFAKLEERTRELANRARLVPQPAEVEEQGRQLAVLSAEIDWLQRELAGASPEFQRRSETETRTGEDVRRALPRGTLLVDLLEFNASRPAGADPAGTQHGNPTCDRRMVAFLLRADRPIGCVDLGPSARIAAAVDRWREDFGAPREAVGELPGDELRHVIWDPLAAYTDDCQTIVVSPDGALARFPFAALPGKTPGSYLIEEVAVAVVPVPRMLPELLAAAEPETETNPKLLLVGDVDYQSAAGLTDAATKSRSPAAAAIGRDGELMHWQQLPSTRAEIVAIRDSFEQCFGDPRVKTLRKDMATEEQFRRLVSGCRYVHLATHGFFSAESENSSPFANGTPGFDAAGFHPGLLCGIVLAGANAPPDVTRDDGILTALEVAELDLSRVELATLSACETGLGKSADGEGLLGLQRAFQVAGARSVTATLWKVRDDATRTLMVEFYENLWEKKLSKIESLRQAQLTMLRGGAHRGLVSFEEAQPEPKKRLPPVYWAGFVLSGDWR